MLFGEDVAFGGVFRCSLGLQDKYGTYFYQDIKILSMCLDIINIIIYWYVILTFWLGWKLQLDKYQGFNAFPAKGCTQHDILVEHQTPLTP